jgi:hypothetical protein
VIKTGKLYESSWFRVQNSGQTYLTSIKQNGPTFLKPRVMLMVAPCELENKPSDKGKPCSITKIEMKII